MFTGPFSIWTICQRPGVAQTWWRLASLLVGQRWATKSGYRKARQLRYTNHETAFDPTASHRTQHDAFAAVRQLLRRRDSKARHGFNQRRSVQLLEP